MSLSIDSLSELACVAHRVEMRLGMHANGTRLIDPRSFVELQQLINGLQVSAPNHKGVLKALVEWYKIALDSFEEHVVKVAEGGEWPFKECGVNYPNESVSPNLLAGTELIGHFLKRSYLKDSFPVNFERVKAFYVRLSRASIDASTRMFFTRSVIDLDKSLLEGRL